MTIDLVILDCDGVLIDSEVISAQVLIDLAAEAGIGFDLGAPGEWLYQQAECSL